MKISLEVISGSSLLGVLQEHWIKSSLKWGQIILAIISKLWGWFFLPKTAADRIDAVCAAWRWGFVCCAPSQVFLLLKATPVLKTQIPILSCFLSLNAVSLWTEICFDHSDICQIWCYTMLGRRRLNPSGCSWGSRHRTMWSSQQLWEYCCEKGSFILIL